MPPDRLGNHPQGAPQRLLCRTVASCGDSGDGVTLRYVGERQDDNNAGRVPKRVTIAEAAALLGCHPNTVRSRVRAGMYSAEKVLTERGPTWMIDRDSLTTNVPTTAPQQPVDVVPLAQAEALQELARSIVREAAIVQNPEEQTRLEGHKMVMEAAKTQVFVASGLLVGMAAVVGILPEGSLQSPLLYLAFGLVILSVFAGILWMRSIARVTVRSERNLFGGWDSFSALSFVLGLVCFVFYVLWSSPGPGSRPPEEQLGYAVGFLGLSITTAFVVDGIQRWRKRRRSGG